ncbi:GNAT family N-acetyltransferase [Thiocapsa bogorovii]|uniref:GNAT family N-acetyltransferase n=1 Tax=Thiocapsa bogorovii TaxID=521689 RepID=UPI001E4D6DB3|nr:GNAT family N-acetyltransferase [Thiocapsa bogorovii]UHD15052.1 GNAT family N-acetyltransferase [Thiocapsa bogorovii]UHD16397.1 GNAT family N-acetyltransferase [Thiocapsa bogorovii]
MRGEGFRIELLGAQERGAFCSGVDALDRYFRERVTQDVRRRVSNCFVLLDADNQVAGYYTFAAAGIPLTDLPESLTKRLPRYPSLPAGLIGRLAVDRRHQRQGLGALLVVDAVARAVRAEPAIYALVVDAKDDHAAAFYARLGFHRLTSQSNRLFIPIREIAKRLSEQGK